MAPIVGSGKVTDTQVAFMVECYLRDSHFTRTLEEFRSEAARILHPLRAVPKGARSLGAVLNEYVVLKEEQISATAERARVEDLFQGLQEILAVYLAGTTSSNSQVERGKEVAVPPATGPCPAPLVSSAATTWEPNPQHHVNYASTTAVTAMPGVASAFAGKEKISSQKRKSQGVGVPRSSSEPLLQGDFTADLAKKPRRSSSFKLSSSLSSSQNLPGSDSASRSDCLFASKTVQPATPPMSAVSVKSQQQEPFSSSTVSDSPQPSPLAPATVKCFVSPVRTSSISAAFLPSAMRDCAVQQHHQDPCTPPPSSSSANSSVNANNSTVVPPATAEESYDPAIISPNMPIANPSSVQQQQQQQQRRAPRPHPTSVTSHYTLRAHKKPEYSCQAASILQSTSEPKPTRKKASNSKCRLLDFSSAAAASPVYENNSASSAPANTVSHLPPNSHQTAEVPTIASSTPDSHHASVPEMPSTAVVQSQDSHLGEHSLSCDSVFFDDFFDLELDTTLISELEDLSPISEVGVAESVSLRSNDTNAVPCAPELSFRSVLTEMRNFNCPGEANSMPLYGCSSASPSKQRKFDTYAGDEMGVGDKENMPSLGR